LFRNKGTTPVLRMPQPVYHNEHDLITSLKQGDEGAYNYIFKHYWKTLYLQAYAKLQSREAAEEIVQELFVTLWEKRSVLLISNLTHYLRMALRNKCIDHIRKQIVKDKYWTYYRSFLPHQTDNAQETVSYNNLMEAVETGIASMPEKTKRIFILNRLEGKSVPHVAQLIRLSEKTVEYHLTKCLKTLKVHLKDFVLVFLVYLAV
jgi:RNA polymerase sigma-70 factor (family 1)